MSLKRNTVKLCSCNGTMSLEPRALERALSLDKPLTVHRTLCRNELASFSAALGDPAMLVCCTQEAELFKEVAVERGSDSAIQFVNIRETAGWSRDSAAATPKIAALIAAAAETLSSAPATPVSYRSEGRLLIVGPATAALDWAERLQDALEVSVLFTSADDGAELPAVHRYPIYAGRTAALHGHLGAFEVTWTSDNPIDLDRCTRCNACVRNCPEQAIGFTYQIDLERCRSHRACVLACREVGAVDFERGPVNHREEFDLVLDLSREPLLRMPQLPRGYAAPRDDPIAQVEAARSLAQWVGEFEKPRYFAYNERICAHARSGKIGCTKCIDVCSTGAITPAGNGVRIDPYLCMGCGGCATVCPSGAVIHTYPGVEALSLRLQRMLEVYAAAGGRAPVLLFHSAKEGIDLISSLARRGTGLPSSVIPVEIHHSAAIGLDLMLSAIAYGAAGVLFLMAGEEAVEYADAVEREVQVGATIMAGLGYRGTWFKVLQPASWRDLETLLAAHATDAPRQTLRTAAAFGASPEKRTTLRLALDHLVRHAPEKPAEITLPAGALFGGLEVDRQACTLCKACIGACPASALIDYQDAPRLQFIEANCLQCGLCVETCPEDALALRPRLRLEDSAREAIVLHEDEIFCCVRCGKAFGTRRLIEQMTARIGTHAMFAGAGAARRLQMCADCRVLDMIERKDEMSIFDLPKR